MSRLLKKPLLQAVALKLPELSLELLLTDLYPDSLVIIQRIHAGRGLDKYKTVRQLHGDDCRHIEERFYRDLAPGNKVVDYFFRYIVNFGHSLPPVEFSITG
jgi:hypothetical protein